MPPHNNITLFLKIHRFITVYHRRKLQDDACYVNQNIDPCLASIQLNKNCILNYLYLEVNKNILLILILIIQYLNHYSPKTSLFKTHAFFPVEIWSFIASFVLIPWVKRIVIILLNLILIKNQCLCFNRGLTKYKMPVVVV